MQQINYYIDSTSLVNSSKPKAEKCSKVFQWNTWNVLNEDANKKTLNFLYIRGRDDQIATSAKLLDTMHKSYGFSGDLLKTIDY